MRKAASPRRRSYAYDIFISILTIISLVIMVAMLLPLSSATVGLLQFYINLICTIFFLDFLLCLIKAPKKSVYFLHEGGWLDLLGSVPSLSGTFKYVGIIRLARLNRLVRIRRELRGTNRNQFLENVAQNRSQYTVFITILVLIIVLTSASVLVLQFESQAPDARIVNGGDALWYALVTITTVGYGDYYPVTTWGRITGMFIMISGVALIGVLASLLSDMLIGSSRSQEESEKPEPALLEPIEQELKDVKNELAAMRQLLEKITKTEIQQ